MKPSLSRFDAIRESREYVFDYDDTERLTLQVRDDPNGLYSVHLYCDWGTPFWARLYAYQKRPTLAKLAAIARDQILLRAGTR